MKKGKNKEVSTKIQLGSILSKIKTGAIVIDRDGVIVNHNKSGLKLLNINDLTGKSRLYDSIDNVELKIPFKKIIESKERKTIIDFELKDQLYFLQVCGILLYNSKGDTIGKLITIDKKSLSRKFTKLREDFVANVSHELKTPLTVIKGSIETLMKGALNNIDEAEHFVKIIGKHTDRLDTLINDILNLSNIEQKIKKRNISLGKYKANKLIEDVLCLHREKIMGKNISIRVECDKNIEVTANKQLLELAISNLVDNAEKYNNENGFIEIKVEKLEDRVVFNVTDSGIGIQQKHIPRLFERFYRVDKIKSRNIGGTGLGL